MAAVIKPALVDFSDVSGGVNTTDPVTSVRPNQITACANAILRKTGFQRVPGFLGIGTSKMLTPAGRLEWNYVRHSGDENIVVMDAAGILYSVNETTGVATSLYDLGGSGEAWAANWQDKCWVCNGTDLVKVEGSTAYPVGIAAPITTPTNAAYSGGTLADGVYKMYVGYARTVAGLSVLYGRGVELADVTLAAGANTVVITNIPNSPDPQVNNKVLWMTDAAGAVYYYYGETGDNTTTSISVSSDANKNNALLYSVEAATNYRVDNPQFIAFHDKRLWVVVDNIVFYSYQEGNVYDLERFDTAINYISYPFKVTGLISLGEHLYINTTQGIIKQPYGDPTARYELVSTGQTGKPFYFTEMRTVDYWNQSVIGLTNDGVRVFDGTRFSDIDLGAEIREEVAEMYDGAGDDHRPCGKVHRRPFRTEYVLSYRDRDVNLDMNNATVVLSLDSLKFYGNGNFHAAWEKWTGGFGYIITKKNNDIIYMQSGRKGCMLLKEATNTAYDQYFFDSNADFQTALTAKHLSLTTRHHIENLMGVCSWQRVHHLCQLNRQANCTVTIGDRNTLTTTQNIEPYTSAPPVFDLAVFDVDIFPADGPVKRIVKLPRKIDGLSVYLTITQTEDDKDFEMYHMVLSGISKQTRFT